MSALVGLLSSFFLLGAAAMPVAAMETRGSVGAQPPTFVMPVVREPKIPNRARKLTEFGAQTGGRVLCTEAFAAGIRALVVLGGGRLIIPAGFWLTGPIVLGSNIELHAERGALVHFSDDHDLYSQVPALISGRNLENVAITGPGVFDGAGEAWRPVKRSKMSERQWKDLVASGGVVAEDGQTWYPRTPEAAQRRPRLLVIESSRKILLADATFQSSPEWNLNPKLSEDITIRDVTIRNPWYAQNGDGLDLESCRNVVVRRVRVDVGDDGICLKSGAGPDARRLGRPTENVLIEDVTVHSGHGGFVIGSEMSGGVRNIRVSNCLFVGTDVGLRFKSGRGRGGVVERIFISHVSMMNIATDAIAFNMYYTGTAPTQGDGQGKSEPPVFAVDESTPRFRDIFIEDVTCRGAQHAVRLQGLPEMPVRDVHFRNVSLTAREGVISEDAENISFDNVEVLEAANKPVFSFVRSKSVSLTNIRYRQGADPLLQLRGLGNAGITVRQTDLRGVTRVQSLEAGAVEESLQIEESPRLR